jgi:uncharacterized protein
MELDHEFTVPAGLDESWAAFNDIESVAECFPGAKVTEVDGDTFKGTVKVKLGPIALVYNGTGTFKEKDESAHRLVIEAKGKDKRGNGTAGADVTATMTEAGEGSTRVQVHTDLAVTGKPAQFGRGVMQDVSDKLLGQFTDCLEKKVGAKPEEDQDAEPASVPAGAAAGSPGTPSPATSPMPESAEEASAEADATTQRAKEAQEAAPASSPITRPQPVSSSGGDDSALDLGATVLPVLAKTYWKQALGVVLVLLVLRRLLSGRD